MMDLTPSEKGSEKLSNHNENKPLFLGFKYNNMNYHFTLSWHSKLLQMPFLNCRMTLKRFFAYFVGKRSKVKCQVIVSL